MRTAYVSPDSESRLDYGRIPLEGLHALVVRVLRTGRPVAGAAVDGLLDGTREEVGVALPKPGKGRHFVACRAEDAMGNLGRLVLTLDVP